jgi:hypothetical protein
MRAARLVLSLGVAAGVAALGVAMSPWSAGQTAPQAPPQQPPAAAPQPQPSPLPTTTIPAQHAQQHGASECLAPLDNATRDIVKASPCAAVSTWNTKSPDKRSFSTVLALEQPESAAFLTVAPTRDGGCDTVSEHVAFVRESCVLFRESALKNWHFAWDGKTVVSYSAPDGHVAYLMQAGAGCVVVEQRIASGAAAPAAKNAKP